MREIKFRAWDKSKNEMFCYDNQCGIKQLNFTQNMSIESVELFEYLPNQSFAFKALEINDVELMQYTGLKDKNDVEIYEGDVVKWGHIKNREECWHRVAFVELFPCLQFHILYYIDGETLEKKQGDNYIFGYSNFIYKDTHNSLEVIGNIYENLELLKV